MYFISTDKICLSSVLFPENFPALQKWIFHLFINNLPYSRLGVLLGMESAHTIERWELPVCKRVQTHFDLNKLEISDVTNTAVDLPEQSEDESLGTLHPIKQ